jgi:glycosyltransferase involved in cell wall biosynthesis
MPSPSQKKIRVLVGANDLLLAGVQRLVIDQLTLLDRSRFDVHLVVLRQFPGRETFYDRIPEDVSVHRLSFKGLFDPPQWVALIRILNTVRPNVVTTATFFSNTVFLLLRPFFKYQSIASEHNTIQQKPLWQRTVDRLLFRYAYTVVGASQMVVDFVSTTEHLNSKYFTVISNGVDLEVVAKIKETYTTTRNTLRATYNIPPDAFVIFTAARLVHQKNHELMISAFAQVCKQRSQVYLVIAGEGALRRTLEEQIRTQEIKKQVLLIGEHKNVQELYTMADCFLLTSRYEGFCIAAMEALAFGLPLISTRVAGVAEYLENGVNGFFVDEDARHIAHVVVKVMCFTDDIYEQFSHAGQATATRYSTARYGEAWNALLSQATQHA